MSVLQVYVSQGCDSCARAREIGAEVSLAYPGVTVEIVDVSEAGSGGGLPEAVIAVPTYLLDGVVVSLGNPHLASLREKLAAAATVGG
jgi:hypothetical protein